MPVLMQAQVFPAYYFIRFKDKNNSAYSLSNPAAYLSTRAIDRRTIQGIPVDSTDLPVNASYINAVLATGASLHNVSKWFNAVTVNVTTDSVLQAILALPFVAGSDYTKPGSVPFRLNSDKGKWNFPTYGEPVSATDVRFTRKTKSTQTLDYGMGYTQNHQIKIDALHELGYTGTGVLIAVIDGGFRSADTMSVFDTLWMNNRILATRDFAAPQMPDLYGSSSHGTSVLSIMGGNLPGQLVGSAPGAQYLLLRSEDTDSEYKIEEDNWASAAEFADSIGADVINSSLGYSVFHDAVMDYTYESMNGNTTRVTKAADLAAKKGIVVCNSAGNSGGSAWQYITAPADGDSVFTIGAVDENGTYAPFSSTGPTADGRIKPNVCGMGQGTYVASPFGFVYPGNGTSFSSPVIAGATACLRQVYPGMTNMQLMKAIEQSADHYNNPDSLYGFGVPDFSLANLILEASIPPDLGEGAEPRISPNPASDVINISFTAPDSQVVYVSLFDINGRVVLDKQSYYKTGDQYSIRLNLPLYLRSGLYFVRIEGYNKVFNKKIVKI
jgi:hypothetical protein